MSVLKRMYFMRILNSPTKERCILMHGELTFRFLQGGGVRGNPRKQRNTSQGVGHTCCVGTFELAAQNCEEGFGIIEDCSSFET